MSEGMTDVFQNVGKKLEVIDPDSTGLFGSWYEVVEVHEGIVETVYVLRDNEGVAGYLAPTLWIEEGKLRWIEDTEAYDESE